MSTQEFDLFKRAPGLVIVGAMSSSASTSMEKILSNAEDAEHWLQALSTKGAATEDQRPGLALFVADKAYTVVEAIARAQRNLIQNYADALWKTMNHDLICKTSHVIQKSVCDAQRPGLSDFWFLRCRQC